MVSEERTNTNLPPTQIFRLKRSIPGVASIDLNGVRRAPHMVIFKQYYTPLTSPSQTPGQQPESRHSTGTLMKISLIQLGRPGLGARRRRCSRDTAPDPVRLAATMRRGENRAIASPSLMRGAGI